MTLRIPSRLFIIAALAPFVLGLASCQKAADDAGSAASQAALAKVAAPAGKVWSDVVDVTADGGYLMGNPNAPVKLIEYGSLSCGHCAKFSVEGFEKLTKDYVASGRVSLEFRSFAIHPIDIPLTMLATCGDKASFFPLIEQIYTNFQPLMDRIYQADAQQKAQAAMSLPEKQRFVVAADALGMTEFFAQRGLSVDQANSCLANFAKASEVAKRADDYGKAGIESTPTLLINGAKVAGSTWQEIETALQRAGAQ